jgi:hypothetical protein
VLSKLSQGFAQRVGQQDLGVFQGAAGFRAHIQHLGYFQHRAGGELAGLEKPGICLQQRFDDGFPLRGSELAIEVVGQFFGGFSPR